MNRKVLIIEDEEYISDMLSYALTKEGFITKTACNGSMGLSLVDEFNPHLILLDLMLPDMNGIEICKRVTSTHNIPIVIITAKSDPIDKILGIEIGADDYITKPFNIREVLARINALFRRIELASKSFNKETKKVIHLNNEIEIFEDERLIMKINKKIDLTNKEYDLLLFLAHNKGKVLSRSQLLDNIWGIDFICDTRTVDIHIQRIRKKLDENKSDSIIETVFGIGYKLVD
ncbi:response regulator transcription factor [Clostridium sp. MSJ-11]|uniref:Response regulator transcription factor n=1 Tax=Clostridium mobile TaxID=2841512 RepID=A0ABS6EIU1_9CLOT|nr:response regulator transcription factor [Clostridium mobile]MBU5485119.1 response regulator transcription factor [Clostridium mobile]